MNVQRQLKPEEQRIATLEYLCGVDADEIGEQFHVSGYTIRLSVVRKYSLELHDLLIEHYRKTRPRRREKNAAHLYLSWRGRDMPQKELVNKNDGALGALYEYVRKKSFVPRIKEVFIGLEGFFYPSNGYERLLRDVFEDSGSFPMSIAEPLFEEEVLREYQTLDDFQLSRAVSGARAVLIDGIKSGKLAMTPTRKALVHEVLSTLRPKEITVIAARYGLQDYERAHTLEETRSFVGNVIRERVRQIEAKALRKLRHPIHSRALAVVRGLSSDRDIDAYRAQSSFETASSIPTDNTFVYDLGFNRVLVDKLYCRAGITTLGQLKETPKSHLRRYHIGDRSFDEIKKKLRESGITLAEHLGY